MIVWFWVWLEHLYIFKGYFMEEVYRLGEKQSLED